MAEVSLKIKKKDGTFLELDKSYLQSIESLTQLTSDPSSIQYGALPNSGSATAVDIDGEIKKAIENGTIDNSNLQAEFWMNGNRISSHIITDSDYTPDKVFSVQMSDNISKWDATYAGRSLTDSMTAYALLKEVLKTLPDNYSDDTIDTIILGKTLVYGEENSTGTIADFLKTITITYPYLKSDTYRNTFAKFCNLAQLQCYQDEDGYPVFVGARPAMHQNEMKNAIHIPKRNQASELSYNLITKNTNPTITVNEFQIISEEIEDIGSIEDTSPNSDNVAVSTDVIDVFSQSWIAIGDWSVMRFVKKGTSLDKYISITTSGTPWGVVSAQYTDKTNRKYGNELKNFSSLEAFTSSLSSNKNEFAFGYLSATEDTSLFEKETTFFLAYNGNYDTKVVKLIQFMFGGSLSVSKMPNTATAVTHKGGNYSVQIPQNELITDNTKILSKKASTFISNQISKDYLNGVNNAQVSLFITDLYNKDGDLVKEWSKGQVLTDGDIVYFDDDKYYNGTQKYWRVTSAKPEYSGAPLFDVELMEVKVPVDGIWIVKTWNNLDSFYGSNIWIDEDKIYYLNGNTQYLLNKNTSTWDSGTYFAEATPFITGSSMWSDGENTYSSHFYNQFNYQYVLNKSNNTWESKTWSGYDRISAENIWQEGNNIYYSEWDSQYVLDKATSTWSEKTWTGLTNFNGKNVWTDGEYIYYSEGSIQYRLNVESSRWEVTIPSWTGLTNFNGTDIWTNGNTVYCFKNNKQWKLDKSKISQSIPSHAWDLANINQFSENFYPNEVWNDGSSTYYSNGTEQYVLS